MLSEAGCHTMRFVRAVGISSVGHGGAARQLAVTCEQDGRTHYVDDVVYERGLTEPASQVIALCGHALVVAPLWRHPPGVSALSESLAAGR